MASKREESVAVIGLGRFGSSLALELVQRGTEVLAVDSNPRVVQALSSQLPHVVIADSTDGEVLHQLGIPEFRRAVVAIGTDLEASILCTSLLVDMQISDIWAKALSRQHGRILERIGAHHVVGCPSTTWASASPTCSASVCDCTGERAALQGDRGSG